MKSYHQQRLYSSCNRSIIRSIWLCTAAALFLLSFAGVPEEAYAQETQRPNVIFILSDDHRYDFMSFHPDAPDFLETPTMDRMAREGMHLQNAFVSTSLCSPSRASILTGQYAHNHGVVDNQRRVPEGTRFFPENLQEAGYETAFVGKWHMGRAGDEPRPGFDHWVSFRGQGTYFDPTLNIDGKPKQVEGYTTDILTDYAVNWLKRDRQKPFFLYLSHKAVHGRYYPPPRHEGLYEDVEIDPPETMANTEGNYEMKPHWVHEQRYGWHGVDHMYHGRTDYDTFYRRYSELVLSLDESIGRVLDYLEESGLADSTIVIYMGDNGFSFGEHGLIDKRQMYESSIRVPLLAWAPGMIKQGTSTEEMILNTDIAPTILDITGAEELEAMDGRSFKPLLFGEEVSWRREMLYEYYWEWNFPHTPTVFGIRTDRYKYIYYHGLWDRNELYDLENDPMEKYNLINSPTHRDKVEELRSRLFDRLEETGGMQIPLRRPRGNRFDERKLD